MRWLLLLSLAFGASNAEARDSKVIREFKREVPCPVTNKRRGACPGHVIDHIIPLCAGGVDHWANLQWQTIADAKKKDIEERRQCAALRKLSKEQS